MSPGMSSPTPSDVKLTLEQTSSTLLQQIEAPICPSKLEVGLIRLLVSLYLHIGMPSEVQG